MSLQPQMLIKRPCLPPPPPNMSESEWKAIVNHHRHHRHHTKETSSQNLCPKQLAWPSHSPTRSPPSRPPPSRPPPSRPPPSRPSSTLALLRLCWWFYIGVSCRYRCTTYMTCEASCTHTYVYNVCVHIHIHVMYVCTPCTS
jgi:hypothetical protein